MDPIFRKFEQAVDLYNQIEDHRLSIVILKDELKNSKCPVAKKRIEWELIKHQGGLRMKQRVYWNFADICVTRKEIKNALQI